MEEAIEAAETKKAALEAELASPDLYTKTPQRAAEAQKELEAASAEVERLYARWQELQSLVGG